MQNESCRPAANPTATQAADQSATASPPLAAEVGIPQLSTFNPEPAFNCSPGETPRAYAAFMTWFNLGQTRSLQAVADKIGEGLSTLKNWSARFDWVERLHSFQTGLLQQQAQDHAELLRKQAADWTARLERFREQEWNASRKLLAAAQCFLESFGDAALEKMTLSQVSRALRISSEIGRSALAGGKLPSSSEPSLSPLQQQLLDAVTRVYGQPSQPQAATLATPSSFQEQSVAGSHPGNEPQALSPSPAVAGPAWSGERGRGEVAASNSSPISQNSPLSQPPLNR